MRNPADLKEIEKLNQRLNGSDLDNKSERSRCLLIDPNPESALNEEAGKLLLEFYDEYAKMAKLWTEIHARRRGTENSDGNISKFSSQTSAESELTTKMSAGSVDSQSGKKEASKRRMKRL